MYITMHRASERIEHIKHALTFVTVSVKTIKTGTPIYYCRHLYNAGGSRV